MPHIIRENKAEVIKEIAIYAILFSDGKSVFVGKCLQNSLKNTYKDHYILRNAKTKNRFQQEKENGMLPAMYLLQTIETSQRLAFRNCVAWAKLFAEQGYELLPEINLLQDYADDMIDETNQIYEKIKSVNVNDLFAADHNLFPTYGVGRKTKNKKTGTRITMAVTVEEYTKILQSAENNNLSLTNYCKIMVLNGRIVHADFDFMLEILEQLEEAKILIRQAAHNIYSRGHYVPADLQNLERLTERIAELQEKAYKEIDKTIKELNR